MTPEDLESALRAASHETSIPFTARLTKDFRFKPIHIRIAGLNEPSFFCLKASRSPIAWTVELEFDLFSSDLVNTLVVTAKRRRDEVSQWLSDLQILGYEVSFLANEGKTAINDSNETPSFQLKVTRPISSFLDSNPLDDRDALTGLVAVSAEILTDLMSDALRKPLERGDALDGIVEGSRTQVLVTRVERSVRNRRACFKIHGHICQGCGLDPLARYGEPARDLLHAHHVAPLSGLAEPRVIDPRVDLVPLCPNCHSLAHKRTPPFSTLEIRDFLKLQADPSGDSLCLTSEDVSK